MSFSSRPRSTGKNNDPTDLLLFDPAILALRAQQSKETLLRLKDFAVTLERYVEIALESKQQDETKQSVRAEPRCADIVDLTIDETSETDEANFDSTAFKAPLVTSCTGPRQEQSTFVSQDEPQKRSATEQTRTLAKPVGRDRLESEIPSVESFAVPTVHASHKSHLGPSSRAGVGGQIHEEPNRQEISNLNHVEKDHPPLASPPSPASSPTSQSPCQDGDAVSTTTRDPDPGPQRLRWTRGMTKEYLREIDRRYVCESDSPSTPIAPPTRVVSNASSGGRDRLPFLSNDTASSSARKRRNIMTIPSSLEVPRKRTSATLHDSLHSHHGAHREGTAAVSMAATLPQRSRSASRFLGTAKTDGKKSGACFLGRDRPGASRMPARSPVGRARSQREESHSSPNRNVSWSHCKQEPQNGSGPAHVGTYAVHKSEESVNLTPRPLTANHNGSLKTSLLERSVGVTRHNLRPKVAYLGLGGTFGQPVVSKNTCGPARLGPISHLTFNLKWNQLPKDATETLQYWLGEGSGRLRNASPLNPVQHKQYDIPVFCSVNQNEPGGALVYYIGHYRSVRFCKLEENLEFLGKLRQALIELCFVNFDKELSDKMATIAH